MALTAAIITGVVGTAISAKLQSDAAKKARRRSGKAADRQIALQEEQFDLFRPLIEGGIESFDKARGLADFDPVQLARTNLRDQFRLLNEDLARTGNIGSGAAVDIKGRAAERALFDAQNTLFNRQASLASLGASRGQAGFQGANSLFAGINNSINAQNQAQLQQAGVIGGAVQGISGLGLQGLALKHQLGGNSVTAQGGPGTSIGALERDIFGRT